MDVVHGSIQSVDWALTMNAYPREIGCLPRLTSGRWKCHTPTSIQSSVPSITQNAMLDLLYMSLISVTTLCFRRLHTDTADVVHGSNRSPWLSIEDERSSKGIECLRRPRRASWKCHCPISAPTSMPSVRLCGHAITSVMLYSIQLRTDTTDVVHGSIQPAGLGIEDSAHPREAVPREAKEANWKRHDPISVQNSVAVRRRWSMEESNLLVWVLKITLHPRDTDVLPRQTSSNRKCLLRRLSKVRAVYLSLT